MPGDGAMRVTEDAGYAEDGEMRLNTENCTLSCHADRRVFWNDEYLCCVQFRPPLHSALASEHENSDSMVCATRQLTSRERP